MNRMFLVEAPGADPVLILTNDVTAPRDQATLVEFVGAERVSVWTTDDVSAAPFRVYASLAEYLVGFGFLIDTSGPAEDES